MEIEHKCLYVDYDFWYIHAHSFVCATAVFNFNFVVVVELERIDAVSDHGHEKARFYSTELSAHLGYDLVHRFY